MSLIAAAGDGGPDQNPLSINVQLPLVLAHVPLILTPFLFHFLLPTCAVVLVSFFLCTKKFRPSLLSDFISVLSLDAAAYPVLHGSGNLIHLLLLLS